MELLPSEDVRFFKDKHYIFAAIGLIAGQIDRTIAQELLKSDVEEF